MKAFLFDTKLIVVEELIVVNRYSYIFRMCLHIALSFRYLKTILYQIDHGSSTKIFFLCSQYANVEDKLELVYYYVNIIKMSVTK